MLQAPNDESRASLDEHSERQIIAITECEECLRLLVPPKRGSPSQPCPRDLKKLTLVVCALISKESQIPILRLKPSAPRLKVMQILGYSML